MPDSIICPKCESPDYAKAGTKFKIVYNHFDYDRITVITADNIENARSRFMKDYDNCFIVAIWAL